MILTPESYLLVNKILVILIVAISFWLGFWVYFADKKNKLNRTFFFWVISTSLWIFLYYLLMSSKEVLIAVVWAKIGLGVVSLFFIPFYLFFIYYLKLEKKLRILNIVVLVNSVIFFVISIFTNLVVKDVEFKKIGIDIILGRGSLGIYLAAIFLAIFVAALLLKNYFKANLQEKLKIQYILVGVFIWALMNSIFNIFPAIFLGKNTPLAPLGNLSFIFLLGFTAFAIVKRELFGIKVILTQFLVGVVAILLLVQAVTAENWIEFAWKFVLFALFLIFGYLLIRSVIQEIQRRAELQRLYNEVDKLSRAKSEFLSIASHQLRTPLTVIKGYISMVLEGTYGKFEDKGKPPLEKVFQSNERLINLVNDLLNISRIESGILKLDLEKVSLEKMISSVLDEMKIKADERKLYLNWEKITPLPQIMADPGKLRQVVLNIIDNSIKYTDQGGITIKSETKIPSRKHKQGLILLTIKDTGEGMTRDEINKMFESFTRGEAGEKHDTSGLGLGLYIAKKFSELHGGKVWAESEGKGKGSTFFVEIPVK